MVDNKIVHIEVRFVFFFISLLSGQDTPIIGLQEFWFFAVLGTLNANQNVKTLTCIKSSLSNLTIYYLCTYWLVCTVFLFFLFHAQCMEEALHISHLSLFFFPAWDQVYFITCVRLQIHHHALKFCNNQKLNVIVANITLSPRKGSAFKWKVITQTWSLKYYTLLNLFKKQTSKNKHLFKPIFSYINKYSSTKPIHTG